MSIRFLARCGVALVVGWGLLAASTSLASAQNNNSSQYQPARPVYMDIHPIAGTDTILNADLVAAMAKQALSERGESVIRMNGDALPNHVRVLRILYIANQQSTANGVVVAASATIDLLRTASDRHDTVLATSIYSGVQQTLAQGTDQDSANTRLRAAFKKTLFKRINQAFTNTAAQ